MRESNREEKIESEEWENEGECDAEEEIGDPRGRRTCAQVRENKLDGDQEWERNCGGVKEESNEREKESRRERRGKSMRESGLLSRGSIVADRGWGKESEGQMEITRESGKGIECE